MRKNLEQLQEKMKQKANAPIPQPIVKPNTCSILGCTRQARRGSSICSRCSYTKQEAVLRDTLPGMPIQQAKEFEKELKETVEHPLPKYETKGDAVAEVGKSTFTRKEVAAMLQVSPTTICRWEKKGVTPLPLRIVRTGQLVYNNEIIAAMRVYRDAVDIPAPQTPQTQIERAASQSKKKVFNLSRRLERTVAGKLGGTIRNFSGSGRII